MTAPAEPPRTPEISRGRTRYSVALLIVVYTFAFIDRNIVNVLLQPISVEFALTDTQLGFFSGTAFGIFYATLGLPIAWIADRVPRKRIVAIALASWSAMTALQGLATGFLSLAVTRIFVGIGEAGCSPPAHSMISDMHPPERRARALATYALGIPIGGALGLLIGGWMREFFGWREAFMVVGLPGLALAVIVLATLPEPTRGYWEGGTRKADRSSLLEVFRLLARKPSFWHLAFAGALHAFYGYGAAAFNPVFFERSHGMGPGEYATIGAAIGLTAGVLGTYLGGALGDRYGARDVRSYPFVPGIGSVLTVPFVFAVYLAPNAELALIIYLIPAVASGLYLGPTFAMTQQLVPPQMRAQAAAVLLLILNLIGLGAGPQFVGWLSEMLKQAYGIESVRHALLWTMSIGAAWSAIHYWLSSKTLGRDLEAQRALGAAPA
ncbi:MAG TPA: MFS transporter [Myxococcota bacterium]|nr:MFS transporter [Myxococcota bacterium]